MVHQQEKAYKEKREEWREQNLHQESQRNQSKKKNRETEGKQRNCHKKPEKGKV